MSFSGDLYPTAGATSVMTTKGDMVDFDTIRQRLAIGSANQILQVKSNLPSWETVDLADTVLTTAGDILYENATPELARLAKGTQYNTLQMGASLPAWSASATSVLTTTGDLLYASAGNVLARLAGGTSGDVLTANGAGVAPSYQTPSGGGGKVELVDQTILGSNAGEIEVAFSSISRDDISKLFCVCNLKAHDATASGQNIQMRVNSLTSLYNTHGSRVVGGTESLINESAEVQWTVYNNNLAGLVDGMAIFVDLMSNLESSYLQGYAYSASTFGGMWVGLGNTTAGQDSFDSVLLRCDSGNQDMAEGSSLTVYRVND